ncbi:MULTISPECIES: helix-turn-helix transcriptional regulator [Erysipelothrix]|uniref:helix-turn-helix transcriptional regulator n=1 Tax=Erysipelothrix TaxID=1647 RepID=UPI0022A80485|nr:MULTISPECIES: helix-turn-helix transcriptional regulator [Erysipelothrix]
MKALRKAKNLSQIDVANAVGVSRQTIISVENGNYNPTLDLCIRICKLLDVTLNDLFWEEG